MNKKIYGVLVFVLTIILSVAFYVFRDFLKDASSLGLVGIFFVNLVSSASLFFPAPSFLTVIAGGNLYPPLLVALIASFGAAFGDMLSYIFGYSGRKLTREKLERNPKIRFLEKHFKKHGALIIFLMALIPNPIFDAIGIFAGVLNYSPIHFFIIILIGRFLRYWLLAQVGASF